MAVAALLVKSDGTAGGRTSHASFIDPNTFLESDINYFIQVKAICKQVVFPELTEFCPIEDLPASEFTRVHGDSFISGFTEGGEFNALISIKLRDPSRKQAGREFLVKLLDSQTASTSHTEDAASSNILSEIDGEAAISVYWRGGEDLKHRVTSCWSLESLRTVTTEFSGHALASPLRIECDCSLMIIIPKTAHSLVSFS